MASKSAKSSSQFSSMHSSTNSLTKSTNGPLQLPNRSKAPAKRPVTPNSRAHETDPSLKAPTKRSVTPISRSHPSGDSDPVAGSGGKVGSKRSVTPILSRNDSIIAHDPEPGRVRVAIRLRPRNAEDLASDADFADCVELQPEMKKVKLRKNNWSSDSYKFDEVLTETASQKRVYQVVAKPVVESVLSGYNGTVMAYGQTGTGKTYTVGNLGKEDASERGMMVRAIEDIISNTSPSHDTIEVSYLQLYMESVQDLLSPEKVNIPIVEDAKTGEVSLPGVAVIELHDLDHFMELLQKGEANRHAANTKMNTNSSRSHAILMVYVRRTVSIKADAGTDSHASSAVGTVRKSKLLMVDLAGSERVGKSGSEGHLFEEAKFINLSLTSLGKCINALAENSPHIPTRESKLTRLLRDSFGGSARTSLIITIGPSARHHAETTSTIMFGQRAMKIVNMVKLKEEFDYESLSRKLESQVDHLTKEIDRQQKLRDSYINEMEKKLRECQLSFGQAEKSLVARSEILEKENARLELQMEALLKELNQQKDCNKLLHEEVACLEISLEYFKQKDNENSTHQEALAEATRLYETQRSELLKQLENERAHCRGYEEELRSLKKLFSDQERSIKQQEAENSTYQKTLVETSEKYEKRITELLKQLDNEHACSVHAEEQVDTLKKLLNDQKEELMKQLEDERTLCAHAEEQVNSLKKMLIDQSQMQSKEQLEITELREKLQRKDWEQNKASDISKKLEELEILNERITSELHASKIECSNLLSEKENINGELEAMREKLLAEEKRRMMLDNELVKLKKLGPENNEDNEEKKLYARQRMSRGSSSFRTAMGLPTSISGQRATLSQIFEEVGLEKVLSLFSSDDIEVQMHAVKMVANLAAEDTNQEKIVNEGGLDALLMLLRSSQNSTILRVASGAIANLAMNESNQGLIMSKGGAQLLASTSSRTDDPQTLRMVAGAISNLCGNVNLHLKLQQEGCIKALLAIAKDGNAEVVAQVARGLANFAKCETREVIQGQRKGRSLLMDDGALSWLIVNSNTTADSTRRHIELALCHLAQNEENSPDFVSSGGLKEVMRISSDSAREDIRNLAKKTLKLNPTFQAQLHAER